MCKDAVTVLAAQERPSSRSVPTPHPLAEQSLICHARAAANKVLGRSGSAAAGSSDSAPAYGAVKRCHRSSPAAPRVRWLQPLTHAGRGPPHSVLAPGHWGGDCASHAPAQCLACSPVGLSAATLCHVRRDLLDQHSITEWPSASALCTLLVWFAVLHAMARAARKQLLRPNVTCQAVWCAQLNVQAFSQLGFASPLHMLRASAPPSHGAVYAAPYGQPIAVRLLGVCITVPWVAG
jgi:hypothetical protein